MIRTACIITLGLLTVYSVLCALLYFFQRSLIYFPQPEANSKNTNVIHVTVDNVNLNIITAKPGNTGAI
ncbi:MAG TPA: hypothetical protein VIM59_11660, partial [Cellvibrio sp.]